MHNFTHLFVCIYHSKFQYIFSYVNTNTSRSNASIFVCSSCVLRVMVGGGQHGGEARDPHVPWRGYPVACNGWCHLVASSPGPGAPPSLPRMGSWSGDRRSSRDAAPHPPTLHLGDIDIDRYSYRYNPRYSD